MSFDPNQPRDENGQWTAAGTAQVNKALEKAGLTVAKQLALGYNHRGQVTPGSGGVSKGIRVKKAGAETRLEYSFGKFSGLVNDWQQKEKADVLSKAEAALVAAGMRMRPNKWPEGTWLVEKRKK